MGDDEIWRSRGNANDKFGIVVENEGDRRDERGSKVHMPHEGHPVKRAGLGLDVPELSVTYSSWSWPWLG
jgi:hypothetical protein